MSAPAAPPLLPSEREEGGAILVAWPRAGGGWRERLPRARDEIAGLVRALLESADVLLLAPGEDDARRLGDTLGASGRGRLFTLAVPYDDVWTRDTGPLAVRRGPALELLDFRFNGWGGKYPSADDDRLVARLAARGVFGPLVPRPIDVVLEGGNLESDGAGTLLVGARCLLDPRRNPGRGEREGWESLLGELLGARRVLWVERVLLPGDDTDGHVDTLARFAAPDLVVYQEGTEGDLAGELRAFRDTRGQPYTLVPLPAPPRLAGEDGEPLPANYANFVLVPGRVLVPAYGGGTDREAARRLREVFPDRDVVALPAAALVAQYGSLHCATMTLPAGTFHPPAAAAGTGAPR